MLLLKPSISPFCPDGRHVFTLGDEGTWQMAYFDTFQLKGKNFSTLFRSSVWVSPPVTSVISHPYNSSSVAHGRPPPHSWNALFFKAPSTTITIRFDITTHLRRENEKKKLLENSDLSKGCWQSHPPPPPPPVFSSSLPS